MRAGCDHHMRGGNPLPFIDLDCMGVDKFSVPANDRYAVPIVETAPHRHLFANDLIRTP